MRALQVDRPGEWHPKMRFTTSSGVMLEYICMPQSGRSNPRTLVFINGWCLRHSEWKGQMHQFPDCNLLFSNLRGHGNSGLGGSTSSTYLQDCALDALELMAHLGLGRVTLVAHSMGCLVGTLVALDSRQVDSMVMVSPVAGNPVDTLPYRWAFWPFLGTVEHSLKNPWTAQMVRWYADNFRSDALMMPSYLYFKASTRSGVSYSTYRKFIEAILDVKTETFLTAFNGMVENGNGIGERMGELGIPVLAVTGNNDFLVSPDSLEILRGRIPHIQTKLFWFATHFPHAERPEDFNRIVGEFVGRKDGPYNL